MATGLPADMLISFDFHPFGLQEVAMSETMKVKHQSIERSVAGYLAAGGTDEPGIRARLQAAHDDETFAVGDEVVCAQGSLTGVVVSISGGDALISWACRGKSYDI
jgi:hypothetical protein